MSEDLLQIGEHENYLQFRERLEKALEKDPNNKNLQEQYADNLIDVVFRQN